MTFGNFVFGREGEVTLSIVGESVSIDDEEVEGMILNGTASLDAAHEIYVGGRLEHACSPRPSSR
jgi:hypothetical protein